MTNERILSRRIFLNRTASFSLAGGLLLISGCGKKTSRVCGNPDQLSDGENSMRASLHYTETSAIKEQVCGGCAFFKTATDGACGTCELLKGPVNPSGHCDSWSAARPG